MPQSADELARARQLEQQRVARLAADAAGRAWAGIDPDNIAESWALRLPEPVAALTAAQQIAAGGADAYVEASLVAQGVEASADGMVIASSLAGVASDGRSLLTLLYQPAIRTLEAIGAGAKPADALLTGRVSLDMIVRTQVADAGRVATGVGVTARNGAGYVRQLNPPSCSRCAILAGRFYRWNQGFQRHPRCDCIHVPTTRAEWRASRRGTPEEYFASLSRAEQDRIFTQAGAQAIRDGADMGRVVNARRGMQTASYGIHRFRSTTEGTTVRGAFGRARRDGKLVRRDGQRVRSTTAVRLMPEQIYLEARGDRDEAIRLLRLHGYLL